MRKVLIAALAAGTMAIAAPAFGQTPIVKVDDPTPGSLFSGQYDRGDTDGDGVDETGTQVGYVGVYEGGVVACNGNPAHTRPDNGEALQGYIWVGPDLAASNSTAAAPGDAAGAGNNHRDASGAPTGDSPCPSNGQ